MANETLADNLRTFYNEMDDRLKNLPPEQQQQYLEGLFHAFDSLTRYAGPRQLSPFEREQFIGSAKSWAYSRTSHLHLDDSRMKELIENEGDNVAVSYKLAALTQELTGPPLDFEQFMTLENVLIAAGLKTAGRL